MCKWGPRFHRPATGGRGRGMGVPIYPWMTNINYEAVGYCGDNFKLHCSNLNFHWTFLQAAFRQCKLILLVTSNMKKKSTLYMRANWANYREGLCAQFSAWRREWVVSRGRQGQRGVRASHTASFISPSQYTLWSSLHTPLLIPT